MLPISSKKRRVVVTGIGTFSPVGRNTESSWENICAGESGIKKISRFDTSSLSSKIAGLADLDYLIENDFVHLSDLKRMDLFIHYGLFAAHEAVYDSGLLVCESIEDAYNSIKSSSSKKIVVRSDVDLQRFGVAIGSGIGGLGAIERTSLEHYAGNKISPFFVPSSLVNLVAGHVAIRYGFGGPNHAVATACASGAHSIGDAYRMILYGDADAMVAGGAEAAVTPLGVAGFAAARALVTKYNDSPEQASRPFDEDRDGFVIAEGACIVVLEELEHAIRRGAKVYCEIVGYGASCDAHHITSPCSDGQGAYNAMRRAIDDAGIEHGSIDYINAHGTSTKAGDLAELTAVQRLFGERASLSVSSTKSATGHLLGAAGSLEFGFAAMSIAHQVAPPTINLYKPISSSIDLVPLHAKNKSIIYAMSNSFGFGGTNVSLIAKRFSEL